MTRLKPGIMAHTYTSRMRESKITQTVAVNLKLARTKQ